jgi:nucleotide-binding universal stress UspA family protein
VDGVLAPNFGDDPDGKERTMAIKAIVSYDDSHNDHDALILGRVLAQAGAELTLAYVRHTTLSESRREQLEEHEAEALLDRGARALDGIFVQRRVVVSGSTPEGLRKLAEQDGADLIVFGSDYRTPAGHVSPQHSTERLLDGGPTGIAIAPAGYRDSEPDVHMIAVVAAPGDDAAIETARNLADGLCGVVTPDTRNVDLLVIGSRPEARQGLVMISAQHAREIENATAPVLVVPRGVALRFPTLATV